MSNYKDINCCNDVRNVDYMLNLYAEEKRRILNRIVNTDEIEIWNEILSRDSHCMCHAGQYNKYTSYTCAPCNNLSKIVDLDTSIINVPFLIECGERVGNSLILVSLPIGKTHHFVSHKGKEKALRFLDKHQKMLECGTIDIQDLTFVQLDTFTNNVITWWIVDDLLQDLPYVLPLHTSYICRDVGFVLSNAPTLGNYHHLKTKARMENWNLSCIALHIAIILDRLSSSYFTHGNANLDTLVFSEEEIEHEYENILVSCSFVTHIVDFTYSSINYDKCRVYPSSARNDILLNYGNLHIEIENGRYKIKDKTDIIFEYIRHSGLPIYTSSFDFYCFIVSLMLDEDFYQSVINDDAAYVAWQSIWLKNELNIIESRIAKNKNKDVDTVALLGGLSLSCNVVKDWLYWYH